MRGVEPSRHVLGTDPRTETNPQLAVIGLVVSRALPLGTELEGSMRLPPCIQVSMRRRRYIHDGETRSGMLCSQTAGTLAASPVVRAASPIYAAEASVQQPEWLDVYLLGRRCPRILVPVTHANAARKMAFSACFLIFMFSDRVTSRSHRNRYIRRSPWPSRA
jgi:hypothetical protein